MEFEQKATVWALLGAVLAIEVAARLAIVLLPARIVLWRKGRWWRWLRYLQALLLILALAGVYAAYRHPASTQSLSNGVDGNDAYRPDIVDQAVSRRAVSGKAFTSFLSMVTSGQSFCCARATNSQS